MRASFIWCLIFLCFWPGWLAGVEVVEGPRVEVAGTEATVRWKTDVPAAGVVRFGVGEGWLNRREKAAGVSTEHEVRLAGLKAGERYSYEVGTARRTLKEGAFTAGTGQESGAAGAGAAEAKRPKTAGSGAAAGRGEEAARSVAAPPAARTWANVATLRDHYERHGADFGATSPEDYAAQAWRFLQRAKAEGLPAKMDPEETLRVWDPKTGAFAAYGRSGRTKTYFKPGSRGYFERQPGRPVRLKEG